MIEPVVICSPTETANLVELLVLSREHYNRHGAQLANALEGLPSVEARHRDIENHQVWLFAVEQP